ncbi:MAG TPA: ATP-binding protein [Actinomycetota bacterium]|nr:ATP-binding protein [Actinomycetota bacterium]
MADEHRVPIRSEADVLTARHRGRELGALLGLSSTDLILVATAISELARNILQYAGKGEVTLRVVNRGRHRGLEIVASDDGPGIPDVARALEDGYSSSGGLGLGLPGARRLLDEFEIHSEPGKGTVVRGTKWAPDVAD